jgi:hypothetical protein
LLFLRTACGVSIVASRSRVAIPSFSRIATQFICSRSEFSPERSKTETVCFGAGHRWPLGANPASEKHSRKSLQAKKGLSAVSEPKTVKVPEANNAEWTPDLVVETSFDYAYSVFQKAKLLDEDHNKALLQLIEKLRHEVFLGD